jgi:hypothetical protein
MNPKLTEPQKDTYSLILQALKFLLIERFDQMSGAGALMHEQRFHLNRLIKLFENDIRLLYGYIDKADPTNADANIKPFYQSIDFVRLTFETAAALTERHGISESIPLAMDLMNVVKSGNFQVVDEVPP